MSQTQHDERAMLQALAEYCQAHGRVSYRNWSPETLRDYLAFHCAQRTFAYVQTCGQIAGTGVLWQCDEREIRAAAATGKLFFNWQATNPQGDSIFLADFVCTVPGALAALVRAFMARFPTW